MNEKIEKLYIDAINEDLPPNVFANEVLGYSRKRWYRNES